MPDKFYSLDELFSQQEKENAESLKKSLAEHDRKAAERLRLKEITPVFMGYRDNITGPYANEDAAIAHAEANGMPLDDVFIETTKEKVQAAMNAAVESDDDEDNEDEEE